MRLRLTAMLLDSVNIDLPKEPLPEQSEEEEESSNQPQGHTDLDRQRGSVEPVGTFMAFMPITGRLEQTASCDFHRVLDAVQVHVADEACANVGHDLEFIRFAFSSLYGIPSH